MAVIRSEDYFIINGVHSDSVGIYVDTPLIPPRAMQRYSTYSAGQDEDRTDADDSYADISYQITFFTFFLENYDNTKLYSFFSGAKTIQISRMPGYYYKIRQLDVAAETAYDGSKIRYTLSLQLSPFRYAADDPETGISSGDIVAYNGSKYGKPVIRLRASGNVTVAIGDITISLTGLSEDCDTYIDSEREIVYANNELLRDCVVGRYPLLYPGDNTIIFSGDISAAYIRKNERWY